MAGLQREGASHIEIYRLVALCRHLIDEEDKLLHTLEDNLRDDIDPHIVLWVYIATVLGAYVASLDAHKGSIVAFYATYELAVYTAVYIIGMSLEWSEMYGEH